MTVFARPEHEFLRVMAKATLTAEERGDMVALARRALDWGQVRAISGLHQLDGVIAWRCQEEWMDGVCPEIVRRDCQERLEFLATANAAYPRVLPSVLDEIRAQGVPYVVLGGAVTYAFYDMGGRWPRTVDHVDVVTAPGRHEEARAVAASLGRVDQPKIPGSYHTAAVKPLSVDGFGVLLVAMPPDHESTYGHSLWDEAFVGTARPGRILGGLEAQVPDPARHFASLARGLLLSVAWVPERLTLNNLVRLYHLSLQDGFDWGTMWEASRTAFDVHGNHASTASPARVERAHKIADPQGQAGAWLDPGIEPAAYIAWAIQKVDAVYGMPAEQVARAGRILARQTPYFATLGPDQVPQYGDGVKAAWGEPRLMLCQWAAEPGIEELIFGTPESTRSRLEAGWWEAAVP